MTTSEHAACRHYPRRTQDSTLDAADLRLARALAKHVYQALDAFRLEHADQCEPKHVVAGLTLVRGLWKKEGQP